MHDRVDLLLRGPAHLHQVGHGDARDGGVAGQRHHGVAMAAEDEGGHVFHAHAEFLRQEQAEAGAVQHAGHADDLLRRQAGLLLQHPHHDVERVGDADDEGVGRVGLDAFRDLADHAGILGQQVIARHARHAGEAGGDDDDIRARDGAVVARAGHVAVEAVHRAGLHDVERLARRDAREDIEHHHIAELLEPDQVGERAADIAGADEGDLLAGHARSSTWPGRLQAALCRACRISRAEDAPRLPTPAAQHGQGGAEAAWRATPSAGHIVPIVFQGSGRQAGPRDADAA